MVDETEIRALAEAFRHIDKTKDGSAKYQAMAIEALEIADAKLADQRYRLAQGSDEEVAKHIAKTFFEDIRGVEWGHSGTEDDESWRREERRYLVLANRAVALTTARQQAAVKRERERIINFIAVRRDGCHINAEEVDCRLCLSGLIQALTSEKGVMDERGR